MRLSNIRIKDFKSIIDLKAEIDVNLNCLVGKNESGKTSILEAISYLNYYKELDWKLTNKNSSRYINKKYPVIYGSFIMEHGSFKILDVIKKYIQIDLSEFIGNSKALNFEVLRWGNGPENIEFNLVNLSVGKKLNLLKKILDLNKTSKLIEEVYTRIIPSIEYYTEEELLLEPCTVKELQGRSRKFETMRRLLNLGGCKDYNDLKGDFNEVFNVTQGISNEITEIFSSYYVQDLSIDLNVGFSTGDKLCLAIKDSSGKNYSIEERSPGFQYFFAFLVNKLYNALQDGETLILLDEPGNNLHPHGAKDLLKSFNDISKDSQVLYTTHNIFLTPKVMSLDKTIFVSKDSKYGSRIDAKVYQNKYQVFRRDLGVMLNDSFLIGDINLVVEGATEKFAFHYLIHEIESDVKSYLEWINIFDAGGVTEVKPAVNYLHNALNLKGVVLLDSDKEGDRLLNVNQNKKFNEILETSSWETIRINDVFKDVEVRTFEDLFQPQDYIECFNAHCLSMNDFSFFDNEFLPYSNENPKLPIVEELKTHYLKCFENTKGKSINKVAIMRLLLDKYFRLGKKERLVKLEKVINLLNQISVKIKSIEYAG